MSRCLAVADVTGHGGGFENALTEALSGAGWRVACLGAPGNLSSEERVDAAFDRAIEQIGGIDRLVLLANVAQARASLVDDGPAEWERDLLGSLRASFLTLRRGLDEFIGAAGGRALIVVTRPVDAETIPATLAAGLISLSKAVATEYGRRGIACNALVVAGDGASEVEAAVDAACFLLSDDAGYVTGELIDLAV